MVRNVFNRKDFFRITGIITAVVIFMVSAVVWAFNPKENLNHSDYKIGTTYEFAIQDKKPFIALFYTDWCTYCMRFMPKYKALADSYKNKYNFVMINAESPAYAQIVQDYAIGMFPTVYIVDPEIDNRILISNTLYDDLGKLKVEFDRYVRIRAMIKQ